MADNVLIVSSSPHFKTEDDTRSIMLDVCIALFFPLCIAIYLYGWRAAIVTAVSVASCVFFEFAYRRLLRKKNTVSDLSAVVTGLLLAYSLPVTVPYWLPVAGAFFAIVIVKQLYGGIGKNFLNPALAARAFLFSWPVLMTIWPSPGTHAGLGFAPLLDYQTGVDILTGPTPLAVLHTGKLPDVYWQDMFLGRIGGSMGEVSSVVLLLGGVYLLVRRIITPRIPLAFLGTAAALFYAFAPQDIARLDWMLYELLSGGLILGAIFMATDYATSPVTRGGQWLYGIGCGLLCYFLRRYGAHPEGVGYAILLMNACVWLLDKAGAPRRYGAGKLGFRARRKGGKTA